MKIHIPFISSRQTATDENTPSPRTAGEYYRQIKGEVIREYSHGDKTYHRHILRELFERSEPRLPFPNGIVDGYPIYDVAPETIDVTPHQFELAKLIDKLNWITRLALTEGHGSNSKRSELFASRAASRMRVQFGRDFGADNLGFSAAVMGGGSCCENSCFAIGLAQSLDDEALNSLGVRLDLSKIDLYRVWDVDHDHSFVVVHSLDGQPLPVQRGANPIEPKTNKRFHSDIDKRRLWSFDPHQLYPMVCRLDKSTYDHVPHTFLEQHVRLGSAPNGLDLGVARTVRERLADKLRRGNNGIDIVYRNRFQGWKNMRSGFV